MTFNKTLQNSLSFSKGITLLSLTFVSSVQYIKKVGHIFLNMVANLPIHLGDFMEHYHMQFYSQQTV